MLPLLAWASPAGLPLLLLLLPPGRGLRDGLVLVVEAAATRWKKPPPPPFIVAVLLLPRPMLLLLPWPLSVAVCSATELALGEAEEVDDEAVSRTSGVAPVPDGPPCAGADDAIIGVELVLSLPAWAT